MSFLPIVMRELRVAARQRGTFRLRVLAALVALLIGSGFLVLTAIGSSGWDMATLGRGLFATLTWMAFAATLSAGLFFTADCLSEEKREGTLGLLFLTDLRGFDVVLGKLLATSLRGSCALLAVFPILAITLLMGGVTGEQFWKTALALSNALFLSLAAGLFVSTVSRDSQKALMGTLLMLLLLVACGPAVDGLMAAASGRAFTPVLSLSSPGFLFVEAGAWRSTRFGLSLLINLMVAVILLGVACLILPRTWQERQAKPASWRGSLTHEWRYGSARRRLALRRRLLARNPVLWLGCRERFTALLPWALALLMSAGWLSMLLVGLGHEWWFVWNQLAGLVAMVLYLAVSSQAARLFVDARRNGLFELLLATPLTARTIVHGQWRALLRTLGAPVALYLGVQLLGALLLQSMLWTHIAATATQATPTTAGGWVVTAGSGGDAWVYSIVALGTVLAGTITVAANLVALAWFGMWMGLNSKSTGMATLKTIAWVQILPWLAISFASALLIPLVLFSGMLSGRAGWQGGPTQTMMMWVPLLTTAATTALVLAKDAFFLFWARRKLFSELRPRAAQLIAPVRSSPWAAEPPILPRPTTSS